MMSICTGVVPCLSTGLAKNYKIFVYLSLVFPLPAFFGHFESLAFFENDWTNLTNEFEQAWAILTRN